MTTKTVEEITKEFPDKTGREILEIFNSQQEQWNKEHEEKINNLEKYINELIDENGCMYVKGSHNNNYWYWKFQNFNVNAMFNPFIEVDTIEIYFNDYDEDVEYDDYEYDDYEDDEIKLMEVEVKKVTGAILSGYGLISHTQISADEFNFVFNRVNEMKSNFKKWIKEGI